MAVISKPDKAIYDNALEQAELLREADNDPDNIAHTLLYLAERNEKLEAIVEAAQTYIQFGQEAQLHANLLKQLELFEDYEVEAETMEDGKFGLD